MEKVPYTSAIGSHIHAMVCTRPDITFVFGEVSRHLIYPGRENW